MYSRYAIILAVFVWMPSGLYGQTVIAAQTNSQTPRQALLEMFFANSPAQFFKHLSAEAQAAVKKNPNLLALEPFSQQLDALQMPGRKLETFDTGPILLRSEDPYNKRTVEIVIDNEYEGLDEAGMQLAPHLYDGSKLHALPFLLKLTSTMKLESGTWRLSDVGIDLHVPVGDRTFLETLTGPRRPELVESQEAAVLTQLRTLSSAEVSYTASFPDLGFTCSLTDLGGAGSEDEPSANAAMLIDPVLATGNVDGYVFSIEGCSGSPVDHFYIVATPANAATNRRAFCTDESAAIRFSEDGSAATCLVAGEPAP